MRRVVLYQCEICGNIILMMEDSGVIPTCCGTTMTRLTENTSDGAGEKHVPVIYRDDMKVNVKVGEMAHPMTPEHHIVWIALITSCGLYIIDVAKEKCAEAVFFLKRDEKVLAAYAYCNLHKLWVRHTEA